MLERLHCTGHKGGVCKKDYVREESLDEQIAVVLKQIEMSDELIEIVKEALKESQKTQVEFRIQALRKIAENETKLRNRLDKSYLDKLDGVISESAYQEMSTKWKNQLRDLERQREKYNDTEFDYYETGGKILELAKRAHQLYLHAESDKKRKIVQLLFSNSVLNGKVIDFTYKKPFNYIAEGLSVLSSSPSRTRTYSLMVNSHPLCRLSYRGMAPKAQTSLITGF